MIAISIVSALVLALFNLKFESPEDGRQARQGKRRAIKNVNWALWFAMFSPVIGVSLGALGAFVLTR